MNARELKIGDVIELVAGNVVVQKRNEAHGGIEVWGTSPNNVSHGRWLWFYPHQTINVIGDARAAVERYERHRAEGREALRAKRAQAGEALRKEPAP